MRACAGAHAVGWSSPRAGALPVGGGLLWDDTVGESRLRCRLTPFPAVPLQSLRRATAAPACGRRPTAASASRLASTPPGAFRFRPSFSEPQRWSGAGQGMSADRLITRPPAGSCSAVILNESTEPQRESDSPEPHRWLNAWAGDAHSRLSIIGVTQPLELSVMPGAQRTCSACHRVPI